jgi:hypothetical protein
MTTVLSSFVDAMAGATELLGSAQVAEHWDEASCLEKFSVGALAGHLLRATITVEDYLDQPEPAGEPIGAAEYYHVLGVSNDVDSPANEAVRARGAAIAAGGAAALASHARTASDRLSSRLSGQDPKGLMRVAGGLTMTVEQYLRTRIVELVIHCDDLAESVNAPVPAFRPVTMEIVIDVLVQVARLRNGDLAVVRALARRERDTVAALRVL